MLKLYSKLVAGLVERGVDPKEARKSAWPALPVAIKGTVKIDTANPGLEDLIINLINDSLPEAQTAGASLFAQAVKAGASQFKSSGKPAKRTAPNTIGSIADEYLAENHIGEQPAVQLASVWPRNETELVADMLYEHTSLPLRVIQDRIQSWPMNRKLDIMEAYVGDSQPGPVLEKAHYCWDLQAPYGTFCELQRRPAEALEIQTLTPRYGFDVPEIIDEAGLGDIFEKCFDTSLELYSALQKAGHPLEAQYAVLYGHNQRWKMTINARQALNLARQSGWSNDTQKLLSQMQQKLAEAHPIIGEAQYNR